MVKPERAIAIEAADAPDPALLNVEPASAASEAPSVGKARPRKTAKPAPTPDCAAEAPATLPCSAMPAVKSPRTGRRAVARSAATPAKTTASTKRSTAKGPRKASAKGSTKSSAAGSACAPAELGYLSEFVGFHLRLAQDASYRAFARIKEKDLVKPGRFPALAIIHLNPGISQSALGRAIARDKSTVSPLIKDLQRNGLISRKPSLNDRRSVTLVLTKKGERVLDRLHARAREHEADLDKLIGASKGRLVGLLDKITAAFAAA